MIALSIIFWLLTGYGMMSFLEWYIHKYQMHKKSWMRFIPTATWIYEYHSIVHHPAYKHDFRIANPKEHDDIGVYTPLYKITVPATPMFVLFGWLTGLWIGAACLWFVLVAHMTLWNIIHRTMHSTKQRWFRKKKIYRYLATYHMMHHLHPNVNFNIVCPGCDWLFGTYRSPSPKDWERIEKEI